MPTGWWKWPCLRPGGSGPHMERITRVRTLFKGRKMRVVETRIDFGNGKKGAWEMAYTDPKYGAAILAVDERERVILVRQFKPSTRGRMLTLPTGGIEKTETPLQCAKKELLEETGYRARQWKFLFATRSNPGYTDAKGYIFLARDLTRDTHAAPPPEDEAIITVHMPFARALAMARRGAIEDQRTVLALLWYALWVRGS